MMKVSLVVMRIIYVLTSLILEMAWMSWRWRRFLVRIVQSMFVLTIFLVLIQQSIIQQPKQNSVSSSRRIKPSISSGAISSTCSKRGDRRGPHQRVISYSIYGNFSDSQFFFNRYLKTLSQTVNQIPAIYPGWIVRIYHNSTIGTDKLLSILRVNENVDLCDVTEIIKDLNIDKSISAKIWRWLPLLDDLVDEVMFRNADNFIITREYLVVMEWLESDNSFHIMRDHPEHCHHIVGGFWGVKFNEQNRKNVKNAAETLFTSNQDLFDHHELLEKYIWPVAVKEMIAHDSYCCEQFSSTRPFPTKREDGEFVGMVGLPDNHHNSSLLTECPEKCRKYYDWFYC